jgi:hypothetical protein
VSCNINGNVQFQPASQFVEQYHGVVSCVFNMEDLILNNFVKSISDQFIMYLSVHFTNQLTDFLATVCIC